MSSQITAVLGIWHRRHELSTGEKANNMYMFVMVLSVAVASIGSALWVSVTSPEGIALLASSRAPMVATMCVAVLWSAALLVGRDRGPALMPLFPLHVLASSGLKRSVVFRKPVLRSCMLVTGMTSGVTMVVSASLASKGLTGMLSVVLFSVAGAWAGVMATVAWLVGQALPRTAVAIALGTLVMAGLGLQSPVVQSAMPWGWVGSLYPGATAPHFPFFAISSFACILVALTPWLMSRLRYEQLFVQATRWQSAVATAASLDFSGAATTYQTKPYVGRRIRVTRPARTLSGTFLWRDAIGAYRTPGRLAVAISAIAVAGVLITLAFLPTMPGTLLGAAAGLLLFAGLGPLTDGVRHAVEVAANIPLYGMSDEALLGYHLLFPLVLTVLIVGVVAVLCSTVSGISFLFPLLSALSLAVLSLLARANTAMKGALPPSLLTPVATPMGDLSVFIQLIWALDGLVLAALAGAAAVLVFQAPMLLGLVAVVLIVSVRNRWRNVVR